ncbi:hypothetical protein BOTBODRAFT_60362 [Botryobasidium botryosum FD-172 SS1]|uniref:BTB domain-containing protein n=1 Tax=Botryobasidium botryosum (strain FD-172 SS1) TaxID=930990 RepID=A0A067LUD1_BOTB1|nr:hypothetical protein BOTBODRAFT_60362 [Botryobasidium botryosum FD-172 SS1]
MATHTDILVERSFTAKWRVTVPAVVESTGAISMVARKVTADVPSSGITLVWKNVPSSSSVYISLLSGGPQLSDLVIAPTSGNDGPNITRTGVRKKKFIISWSSLLKLLSPGNTTVDVWVSGSESDNWHGGRYNIRAPSSRNFFAFEKLAGTLDQPGHHDVSFHFPGGRQLWADRAILRQKSPYYDTMFSSGLQESSHGEAGTPESPYHPLPGLEPDSDVDAASGDELDPSEAGPASDSDQAAGSMQPGQADSAGSRPDQSAPPLKKRKRSSSPTKVDSDICHIFVRDATYKTFRALLYYIYSDYIVFAPLSSLFEDQVDREKVIQTYVTPNPAYPVPVSCKSIYALAHKYELRALESAALEQFQYCLNSANVMVELLGPFCRIYRTPKELALKFVADHWKEVKGCDEWAIASEKAMTTFDPHFTEISCKILEKQG